MFFSNPVGVSKNVFIYLLETLFRSSFTRVKRKKEEKKEKKKKK